MTDPGSLAVYQHVLESQVFEPGASGLGETTLVTLAWSWCATHLMLLYTYLVRFPLLYFVLNSPRFKVLGFDLGGWNGLPRPDICSALTGVDARHWYEHPEPCIDRLRRSVYSIEASGLFVLYAVILVGFGRCVGWTAVRLGRRLLRRLRRCPRRLWHRLAVGGHSKKGRPQKAHQAPGPTTPERPHSQVRRRHPLKTGHGAARGSLSAIREALPIGDATTTTTTTNSSSSANSSSSDSDDVFTGGSSTTTTNESSSSTSSSPSVENSSPDNAPSSSSSSVFIHQQQRRQSSHGQRHHQRVFTCGRRLYSQRGHQSEDGRRRSTSQQPRAAVQSIHAETEEADPRTPRQRRRSSC